MVHTVSGGGPVSAGGVATDAAAIMAIVSSSTEACPTRPRASTRMELGGSPSEYCATNALPSDHSTVGGVLTVSPRWGRPRACTMPVAQDRTTTVTPPCWSVVTMARYWPSGENAAFDCSTVSPYHSGRIERLSAWVRTL